MSALFFYQPWHRNRIEIHPVAIKPFTIRLFNIRRAFGVQGFDYAVFVQRIRNSHGQDDAAWAYIRRMRLVTIIAEPMQGAAQ